MELPDDIKQLYNHWEFHTLDQVRPKSAVDSNKQLNIELIGNIADVISERMRIWEKKTSGQKPPFTKDAILREFRFCNIYRELDRQTIEIHRLLKPIEGDFELWLLNLAFNRFLCNPETFHKVGFLSFDEANNRRIMQKLVDLPRPKYGSAYIFPISVIQKSEFDTREKFFTLYLPKVIPRIAKKINSLKKASVVDSLAEVLTIFGFNLKFHWTEILIDVAYNRPELLDLYKRFPLGPGSIPTIKRLSSMPPEQTLLELTKLQLPSFPYLEFNGRQVWLSAENWEGIGCEFRKYSNLSKKAGRRRFYRPR